MKSLDNVLESCSRLIISCLFLMLFVNNIAYANVLTLKQSEIAALSQAPEIKSLRASTKALGESAIADGQLSDPKLMLGLMNAPVDTFDLDQEPMTQLQIGVQQAFPRGRTLHFRMLQKQALSLAESKKQQLMRLQVLRGVRMSWLNVYYWLAARRIILKQKRVFHQLVKVTESMLANNKAQQKDVIRAQLELTELNNRLLIIKQQIDTARAQLGRWIGPTLAQRAMPTQLKSWPTPPDIKRMETIIKQHPILKVDEDVITANHRGVDVANQQYWPGFNVGILYGVRQGRDMVGRNRPDFLSAQVSLDVPLFTRNRQDRTVNSSHEMLNVSKENQMSHYRQLRESLKQSHVMWVQQRKSTWLYEKHLIPEAKHYAKATMTAYQNAQTDFPTLARAYVRELNTQLAGLKTQVNREVARVKLLYLQGI